MNTLASREPVALSAEHIADLRLASSLLSGARRRAFQVAITERYCAGNARHAERVFGWGRHTVELGRHERRTGIVCLSAHAGHSGKPRWEQRHPEVAEALWRIAETHSQQDPSFRTSAAYTRLTAAEALTRLRGEGFGEDQLPSPSTLAAVLNRNGYRLRKVLKAKPQKNSRQPRRSSPTSRPRTVSL